MKTNSRTNLANWFLPRSKLYYDNETNCFISSELYRQTYLAQSIRNVYLQCSQLASKARNIQFFSLEKLLNNPGPPLHDLRTNFYPTSHASLDPGANNMNLSV